MFEELELIALELEGTPFWRFQKDIEWPDDQRNADAANLLERLAREVRELTGSHVHVKLSRIAKKLGDASVIEEVNEYRRRIGFSAFPSSGSKYLENLIEIYEQSLERAGSIISK
jgi:hypothetical protein